MPCCGQNREKAQAAAAPAPAKTVTAVPAVKTSASAPPPASGPTAKLHYTGVAAVRVRGPQTGRTYEFSGASPDARVDRRDADGLIRIGLFRRAV
jgi:hypothetical protein